MTEATTAVQPPLLIQEQVQFEFRNVYVATVVREPWGAPPEQQLIDHVGMAGIIQPVVFQEAGDGLRILEGRRRFQAAELCGMDHVPGLVVQSELGVGIHALVLGTDLHEPKNSIIHLQAIEEIMVGTGEKDAVEIARRAKVPLSLVRKRLQLQTLNGELRDGWMAGQFPAAVGEAAAKLDPGPQRELVKRLRANGTLTAKDVQDVKKTGVTSHQRTLPDDNWRVRTADHLRKARDEIEKHGGEDSPTLALVNQAITALSEESD